MGAAHRAAKLKMVLKFIGFNLAEIGIGEPLKKNPLLPGGGPSTSTLFGATES
jgi:hypothetical protein